MQCADITGVAGIERQTPSPWSQASLAEELRIRHSYQLVAEGDAGLVGWCCCRVITPEAELCKIAVKEEARKQGVASSLFAFLVDTLRDKTVATLFLEVRSRNSAGVSFYQKNGFSQVGIRPGYYDKPGDSALIFMKNIQ